MKRLLLIATLAIPLALAQEHGKSEGGHEEDQSMWKWANFGILVVLMGWVINKHAPAFFKARTDEIQKSIKEAQQTREEAEKRASAIEAKIANLGAELETMRTTSKQEMEAEGTRIQQETARMLAKAQDNAKSEIASIAKQAEVELKAHASKLALELAEKKLRDRLTPMAQSSLVSRFVQGLNGPEGSVN
ncbi:MAG: ATP synthase F0 subunit B [Bryobacteraceae bacterium]